jgi:DNA mismatch repair protein MutS
MADAPAPTPMMAQYLALKQEAGDCLLFYRMGDFFELFFDDARTASSVLDIALTTRGEHAGEPVPMCGVPVHSAESYLARLIRAGCRVAIAEQVESPEEARARGGSKTLVTRDIVRFVTAGTLTEEALLEPRRANLLVAACELRGTCGVASCDISTGRMELEECAPADLGGVLARLGASELVAPEDWDHRPLGAPLDAIGRARTEFSSEGGEARLKAIHSVSTLEAFGQFGRAMLAAAGGLVAYLDHVGRGTLPLLLPPVVRRAGDGCRDPGEPGDHPGAGRRPCRQPARNRGPLRHRCGRAASGGGSLRPARRQGADRGAAGPRPLASCRPAAARGPAGGAARSARHRPCARPGGCGQGQPSRSRPAA